MGRKNGVTLLAESKPFNPYLLKLSAFGTRPKMLP
jgi:hypothetical protein